MHKTHKEGRRHAVTEVKQQFALKRIQANQHVKTLTEQLQRERMSKQMAELSIQAFNKQIEQEKAEIKKVTEELAAIQREKAAANDPTKKGQSDDHTDPEVPMTIIPERQQSPKKGGKAAKKK